MAAPWRGGGPNDGWNDPPMFSYNAATSTEGHSHRTHLNKRVAYPLSLSQGSTSTSVSKETNVPGTLLSPTDGSPKLPPIQILPPTSSTSVHPPVPLLVPNMSPPVDASSLPPSFASAAREPFKSETLPELLERLELESADSLRKYTKRVLHETVDKLKDNIQGRSREDVQQRLGVLDDQWREDKISEGAKIKLGCLASAIQNDDLKCADSLHLSLMVDHISEVSQWMVGVKRLINELKLLRPPPSTKTGDTKHTLFSPLSNFSENNTSTDYNAQLSTSPGNELHFLKFDAESKQEKENQEQTEEAGENHSLHSDNSKETPEAS